MTSEIRGGHIAPLNVVVFQIEHVVDGVVVKVIEREDGGVALGGGDGGVSRGALDIDVANVGLVEDLEK